MDLIKVTNSPKKDKNKNKNKVTNYDGLNFLKKLQNFP